MQNLGTVSTSALVGENLLLSGSSPDGKFVGFVFEVVEDATAPGEGAAVESLTGGAWQWTSFSSPVEQFDVEMPESYVLTFDEDGTFNIVADCDNAADGYTDEEGTLTIEVGPATMALCPDESRGEQFVTLLGGGAHHFFEDGMLYIDLMADGGTMAFAPVASADTSAGELPADTVAQLDAWLESQVYTEGGSPAGATPGLVLLVDTPEGRYLKAAGVSSLEEDTPMQWEAKFEPNSYGFRPGRSAHDAIQAIFNCIRLKPKSVLDANIEKCFDNIAREPLLDRLHAIRPIARLVRGWLEAGILDGDRILFTETGVPPCCAM